ncbi:translocation/assembly module TamB domain-containing protein [Sphingomicrobium lutaoense]|uniref:Translocation and assembly module TamB n=1 Tax=Sphingomicrobium lutaoense TaxID=515949 RepID=A0A839YY31_9SPHN|nr:translocation/assembly module TamB domain-containing protein [Sphingomicrobium lutaoense]MBB3763390.1 translocation and assembly module TamB [Sphingomicrobium lutaoense]
MAEEEIEAPSAVPRRKPWYRRLARETGWLLLILAGLFALALAAIDSAPGKRFLADRIAAMETASGLSVRIGRIEGSIYDRAVLRNVEVHDTKGVFLTSPAITLEWAPFAWLYNKLHIDELSAETVRLERLPVTRPSRREGPILPGFDIHIGKLSINDMVIGPAIGGEERRGKLAGRVDIRAGRALVDLKAAVEGGDRLAIRLDASPDDNRLDLGARVVAPADGVLAGLLGLPADAELALVGKGDWANWSGNADIMMGEVQLADLALTARNGDYGITGTARPAALLDGTLKSLLAGPQRIDATGRFDERRLSGEASLRGAALDFVARGAVDLGNNRYEDVRVAAQLKRPSALLPTLGGQPVRLAATLDGPMDNMAFTYRLRGAATQIDTYRLENWQADGRGRWGLPPVRVPLTLTAARVSGGGDLVTDIFSAVKLEALLQVSPTSIRADDARLQTRRLRALVDLSLDLSNGDFDVAIDGRMAGYELPGIGRMDISADLSVRPAPGGGTRLAGPVRVDVRRLDNGFFRGLTGGNPTLTSQISLGPDGILRLGDLRLASPEVNLRGNGLRRRDGTFYIEARGEQAGYGPVEVTLDGNIARPEISLRLERPNEALGLNDVAMTLRPTREGFDFTSGGGSRFGPFAATGAILLPAGRDARIEIARLDLAGSSGSGSIAIVEGGFDGQLALQGGEVGGTVTLKAIKAGQRIDLDLTLDQADFPGPPAMRFASGRVDARLLLTPDGGMQVAGTLDVRRARIAGMTFGRVEAQGSLRDGTGSVSARLAGLPGSNFNFNLDAAIASDRIALKGEGALDRVPIRLANAVLSRDGSDWLLSSARLSYAGGQASLAGRFGQTTRIDASLKDLPLSIFDLADPDLGLGGKASGSLDLDLGPRRSGNADLQIKGLSRSGLVLASRPIDVALKAKLEPDQLGMRAVIGLDGKRIGRAQARLSPLGNGDLVADLMRAPIVAQLRYDGPADTLWRLSGFELFDLSGPMAAALDVRGSLLSPDISGAVQLKGARLESPVTGMVLRGVQASGHFDGSRLRIADLRGATPGGGSVSGAGQVIIGPAGVGMDLSFETQKAAILARDDIAASVTGPIRVRSSGNGGTISGNLRLDEGKFTLGRAGTVAAVPRIEVVERGLPPEEVIERTSLAPWALDLDVKGGPLEVRGLGIDSSWRADLAIGGTILAPRLRGVATLRRGEYNFAGRNFDLTEGEIRFRGQNPPDPLLNIVAESQLRDLTATVAVAGTGLNPQISFTSVPALPEDELLARLLFGTSITNLSVAEAAQLGVAVASLRGGGGGLDPINSIREAIGLDRLRILPADVATGQKTAVAAGKYITRRLFVEVISDGQGYTATQAEFQVTRWLSILAAIDSINRSGANVRISKDY